MEPLEDLCLTYVCPLAFFFLLTVLLGFLQGLASEVNQLKKDRNVKPRRRAQEFEVSDEVWS